MRITIICDVLGKENNGTTIAAMNLIRSLRAAGHEVTVVCSDEQRRGTAGYVVMPTLRLGPLDGYVKRNGVSLARSDRRLMESAITGRDVVHLMLPFMLGHAALPICREHHIPVTAGFHAQAENITSHLFLKDSGAANRLVYRYMYNSFYRHVDAVHYPTDFIRETFETTVGHTTNGYVISNGVGERFRPIDVSKPAEYTGKFVILFSGRYSKEKSHDVLIDAVALSQHEKRIQLIFAGDGPLRDKLRERSRKLTNMPVFNFFPHNQMLNVLNYADLYVHPAEIEIEAIACMEAIACGRVPIIADSPRSATKKFALTPDNLFENRNPSDLARKIDFFIENPDMITAYRAMYRSMADEYRFDACMKRMEQMLKDVAR